MCRSIKTLRPPYLESATADDAYAAALQYVRKISGFRKPARVNEAVFQRAVEDIAAASMRLLEGLVVRPAPAGPAAGELEMGTDTRV